MTARPITGEREKALEAARRIVAAFDAAAIDGVDLVGHEVEYLAVCKALLSPSASERGMREALEKEIAAKTWNAAADFLDGKVEDMGDGWRVIGGARDTEKFMQRAWREASRIFRVRASDLAALTSKGEGES